MARRTPRGTNPIAQLRHDAELRVALRPRLPFTTDPSELVHELEIHRVELEMQNEELRRTQSELADARDRYQELYDLAPVAYLTMDRSSRIAEANLAASQLLGRDRLRLGGTLLSVFVAPGDVDAFHRFRQAVFQTGRRHTCDLTLEVADRQVPVHLDALAAAPPAKACRCVIVDLSELREAQAESRAQAARIQAVVDTAPNAIIDIDATGRIETFSAAATRMFGYRADDLIGQSIRILVPSLSSAGRIAARQAGEDVGLRKDGTTLPLLVAIGEWWDRGQRKLTAILHDITESATARRRLHDSDERFRQITETIDDAFYVRERDAGISYMSPAYVRLRGEPIAELYAHADRWSAAVHPEDRDQVAAALRRLDDGQPYDEEYRISKVDGTVRWVRDRAFPVRDRDGRMQRAVGVIHDVTIERELELSLRQAQKMEAVGALASGVAHDINNVLQVVLGVAELGTSGGLTPDRVQVHMRRISDAARRGADLVHRLLTFARKERLAPRALSLDAVVGNAIKLVKRLVTEIRVELALHAPRCFVLADAIQIEQVLLNLATNARDAMPDGGTLTIETDELAPAVDEVRRRQLRPAERYVRLAARDTGIGMDETVRARIFEPFYTTKHAGKGTGLGLATVYTVARELGGDIQVDSAVGEGTRFVLVLPCCAAPTEVAASSPAVAIQLHGRALVVDDDPAVRATVCQFIQAIGIEVVEAATRDEALRLSGSVDVVVTDVVMPEASGPHLIEQMRRSRPDLRVLFVSAHSPGHFADAGSLPLDAPFLQKPFSRDQLAAKLAELLA